MKSAKLLSLGLIAFALFGCNETPAASNNDNLIESVESQQQDSNSSSASTTSKTIEPGNPSKIVARKTNKTGRQIGRAFDCNGDGISNGARIDYDGDGIPDECIESDEKTTSIVDETSYDTALKSLNSLTKGCKESKKTPQNTDYYICKNGNTIVKAGNYNSEAGAGLDYWLVDNRVIAAQRPHSQELFLYNNNGKLKSKFIYPRKVGNISSKDRQDGEFLYDGYKDVLEVFNNNSTIQSSSGNRIIDETSFQTFSKSLDAITQGCQKTKKSGEYTEYEICKKGNTIVNASEYSPEAGAGLAYWFADDRVVAMRYLANGDTFTFDSNGKVSAKFNVYDSKKISNISAEERKHAEGNISSGSYKGILQRF